MLVIDRVGVNLKEKTTPKGAQQMKNQITIKAQKIIQKMIAEYISKEAALVERMNRECNFNDLVSNNPEDHYLYITYTDEGIATDGELLSAYFGDAEYSPVNELWSAITSRLDAQGITCENEGYGLRSFWN